MSTDFEGRPEGAAREEGQNTNREGGYKSYNSYNRYNNDGEQRSYRPRTNDYNREGGYTPRPRTNSYNRGEGGYTPRPRFNAGEEGEQRQYRPRTNNYNREGGYTPRPRFNAGGEEGEQRQYRPRTNNYNREGGYTPRPRFNSNREGGEQRAYTPRPRFNAEGGEQRAFRPRTNNYNQEGGERPFRPRTNNGGYDQQGPKRPFRPRTADYNPNAKYSKKKQIEYKDILTDPNEPIRLNKFLANAGVCSRREADEFIEAGVISVNGVVVTELGTKILRTDEVKFHDQPVNAERKVYILLNKPKDCVTTSDDPQERKTVLHCVKDACKERIYPVGRLDRNTTGVLLLTNDGDLASKLTHPKFLKKKIYHVYCDKNVTKADLDQIAAGITLEDGEIHADAISYASDTDKSQVGIEIHSGKNRIVRRIFESLGYRVNKLDRV